MLSCKKAIAIILLLVLTLSLLGCGGDKVFREDDGKKAGGAERSLTVTPEETTNESPKPEIVDDHSEEAEKETPAPESDKMLVIVVRGKKVRWNEEQIEFNDLDSLKKELKNRLGELADDTMIKVDWNSGDNDIAAMIKQLLEQMKLPYTELSD